MKSHLKGSLDHIHRHGDYLSHGALMSKFAHNPSVEYRHASFLFEGGRWQGSHWGRLDELEPIPDALVIGHSDLIITGDIANKIKSEIGIPAIYASNLSEEALSIPGVFDLPLGIPNKDRSTRTHRIQSSRRAIRRAWKHSKAHRSDQFRGVNANFAARTNPEERSPILEVVADSPHLYSGTFAVSNRGRLTDLREIGFRGLNICPPGNGPDTHRVWETLLMGAFPVVIAGDHASRLMEDLSLPCVRLDKWADLRDQERLSLEFEALRKTEWDYQPLTTSFWTREIGKKKTIPPS